LYLLFQQRSSKQHFTSITPHNFQTCPTSTHQPPSKHIKCVFVLRVSSVIHTEVEIIMNNVHAKWWISKTDIPVNCRNAVDSIQSTKCILLHFLDDRTIVNLHCYGTTLYHLQKGVQMKEIMSPNFFSAGDKRGWTIRQYRLWGVCSSKLLAIIFWTL